MNERLRTLLGPFGVPHDAIAWAIFGLGAILLVGAVAMNGGLFAAWIEPGRRGMGRVRFLMGASFAAAFLSLGYIAFYLRGGPRIIDATTYFLQGRALAQGSFTWEVIDPTASFRGRFLLFTEPHRMGGIFPPGYPLLLAFGFVIGAPMVIGPLLAAAIVCATYVLARELALPLLPEREVERAARGATVLSVLTAALRYHTADTMAHGAAALALTIAAAALLRGWREAQDQHQRAAWAWLGFAVGGLIATRPISAIPIAVLALSTLARTKRVRPWLRFAIFAAPGVLLLLASQKATTGSWFASTQKAYYAVSDGPPGCFRYGFGDGVGCVFEHGDFVKARLQDGYGLVAALGTTLRRIRLHLGDVTNFELVTIALLVPAAALVRKATGARLLAVLVLGQILVYAPFYFDGSYPGGGARFYADVIPLEHVLFVVALAARAGATLARPLGIAVGAGAAAFAFHGLRDHEALRDRDGGRPMFEPDLVREAHKDSGLLFFDTDHGFDLAYQPGLMPSHGILAVRRRNDDRDRYLFETLGRPNTHRYVFGAEKSSLEPWVPPASGPGIYRFESEAEWPPLSQSGGWVEPAWANAIASNDQYLRVIPAGKGPVDAEIDLLVPTSGRHSIEPSVVVEGLGAMGTLSVVSRGVVVATWELADPKLERPNVHAIPLAPKTADLAGPARIRIHLVNAPLGLDRFMLRRTP